MTRYRVIEHKIWLWEFIVQYVQRGEWMFVVQYGENTMLFLCNMTKRFRANLFKDLWISEKTSKQFGLLSDNSNVKFLWIFCVTPWLLKIFSLIRKIPTEQFLRSLTVTLNQGISLKYIHMSGTSRTSPYLQDLTTLHISCVPLTDALGLETSQGKNPFRPLNIERR